MITFRKYIALAGMFSGANEQINENHTLDLRKYPEHGAQICDKLDLCVGLSQNMMGDIMKLETIFLPNFIKDENLESFILQDGISQHPQIGSSSNLKLKIEK